jgi:hypothetical protein
MDRDVVLIVRVSIRNEGGIVSARSDDLPGLFINADSVQDANEQVIKAIKALFKYQRNLDVEVSPASTDIEHFPAVRKPVEQFAIQKLAA